MHENEPAVDRSLVRRLLAAQFPEWADRPIVPFESTGTTNFIYRLGDDVAARLPRVGYGVRQVDKEGLWLEQLAPLLPLDVPVPLATGEPGEGYPYRWSICPWLEGEPAAPDRIDDPCRAAVDLAEFIACLQRIDTAGGPLAVEHGLRGAPLATRDRSTREAIAALEGSIDTAAATAVWEAALDAPEWDREPVWLHGDLLPGNLLCRQGRLSAVIDFGSLGVGDPACELMIAWSLFSGESRKAFREALGVDDATWARGRGHALSQPLIFIPYYLHSNPDGVAAARRTLDSVLADFA